MTVIKWLIGLLIVAGGAWALWWSGLLPMKAKQAPAPASTTAATTTPQVPAPINGMSAQNDASDAAISQDAAALDAQMQALDGDTTSLGASFADKPIIQN